MPRLLPILMVDDSADDVALTTRALGKAGVLNEVHVARDGVEAMEYLGCTGRWADRDPSELPAVVLLDLKMPRMDGMEVLQRIRAGARTRNLPVVILTSSREEQDVTRGYDLGANSYVQKPVEFAEFARAVQRVGVFWALCNVPPTRGE